MLIDTGPYTEVMKLLRGVPLAVDVNRRTARGATAVRLASSNGRTQALRVLIELGADVDLPDSLGW